MPFVRFNAKMSGTKSLCLSCLAALTPVVPQLFNRAPVKRHVGLELQRRNLQNVVAEYIGLLL